MVRVGLRHRLKSGEVEMPYGLVFTAGTTVPTDGDGGYPTGSMWIATAGTASHTLYINEGSDSSCDFNRTLTA